MSRNDFTRRDWLKWMSAGGAALATAGMSPRLFATPLPDPNASPDRKRVLRFAHITDIHVEPELDANLGFIACLKHIDQQADKVDAIFNTGDCVYDSMHHPEKRVGMLWDLWSGILNEHVKVPIEHAIGNHDVWGLDKVKSKVTGSEPHYLKGWAMEVLGLKSPYRSFDRAAWHVIVLDSVRPWQDSYRAYLDPGQMDWLAKDLAQTDPKTPVLVMSHIPILSGTVFMAKDLVVDGEIKIGGAAMHTDCQQIRTLFKQHPNVKLCISGHVHLIDRFDYNNVAYICDGAVSGGWWKETNDGDCDAGYSLIDLYDDGSFDHEYVTYDWKYRTPTGKADQT